CNRVPRRRLRRWRSASGPAARASRRQPALPARAPGPRRRRRVPTTSDTTSGPRSSSPAKATGAYRRAAALRRYSQGEMKGIGDAVRPVRVIAAAMAAGAMLPAAADAAGPNPGDVVVADAGGGAIIAVNP